MLVGLGLALSIAVARPRSPARLLGRLALLGGAVFGASVWTRASLSRSERGDAQTPPTRNLRGEFAGSESCRSCHPSEHASWHRSFHRTMTSRPNEAPEAVEAPVPSAPFRVEDQEFRLERDAAGAMVAVRPSGERVAIVLATGSHHYQAYWTTGPRPGELQLLPFVYLARDRTFAPRRAMFLTPESAPPSDLPWSASCVQCHAVAGRPRLERRDDGESFRTDVAELGIACEACHGPGAAHAESHRNPFERAASRFGEAHADPTIVNPARLDAARSVDLCAGCHSLSFPRDEAAFWDEGAFPEPPDQTWKRRSLLTYASLSSPLGDSGRARAADGAIAARAGTVTVDASRDSMFWRDGTIRIGGREANAHYLSPCFAPGPRQSSCLSCHSMHESEPDDQLRAARAQTERPTEHEDGVDEACLSCHGAIDRRTHTHHAPGSSGSRCVSCHMPRTTFALLQAIRTHRVESPNVAASVAAGRIPACNLCHLDRSLRWSESVLDHWRDRTAPASNDEENDQTVGAAIGWLLRGDAAQRALAAAHLGLEETRQASGDGWQAPLLAQLFDDPYAAVRYVAARSLSHLPGYEDVAFDFVGERAERRASADEVRRRFDARGSGGRVPSDRRRRVLLSPSGASDRAVLEEETSHRDDRAITIAE